MYSRSEEVIEMLCILPLGLLNERSGRLSTPVVNPATTAIIPPPIP